MAGFTQRVSEHDQSQQRASPPARGGRARFWLYRANVFFKAIARTALVAGERLPPGVRGLVGVVLMLGGVLGFLPVLGFWMFPAGVAMLSLDVPPLRRKLDEWLLGSAARHED